MRLRILMAAGLLFGLAYAGAQPLAHHALGVHYRETEEQTIEGVVIELVYRNPHAYVYVNAPGRGGHTRVWAVECGAPINILRNDPGRGLRPGDRVVVTGMPGRDPAMSRLFMKQIVRPSDGRRWTGARP